MRRSSMALFLALSILLLAAAQGSLALFPGPRVPVFETPVMEDYAVTDVTMVLLGLRRLGADLAMIELLQYYGGDGEEPHDDGEEDDHAAGEGAADLHPEVRLALFPQLKDYALRAVSLDPYFHYAYLFSAGALGFNLNRDDEAVDLLRRGTEMDPSFWQYRLYAGAIGFRKSAETGKVIDFLEEAIRSPDCPSMLMNILANIHKKAGNYRRAAEIYIQMIQTSRDENYVLTAKEKLKELQERHGIVLQ